MGKGISPPKYLSQVLTRQEKGDMLSYQFLRFRNKARYVVCSREGRLPLIATEPCNVLEVEDQLS